MRFIIFCILLCIVFFCIGWFSNDYRKTAEPIVKWKTKTVMKYIFKPTTVDYAKCYLSSLQIEAIQKNTSIDISCTDDCKSAQRTMEIAVRKEKYKNIIQIQPFFMFGYNQKKSEMLTGGSISYYRNVFYTFYVGGGISYAKTGLTNNNYYGINAGILYQF